MADYQYLDQNGVSTLWSKIKSKFGRVDNILLNGTNAPAADEDGKILNIPSFGAGSSYYSAGLVPSIGTSDSTVFLRGDGTWASPVGSINAAGAGLTISGSTMSHASTVSAGSVGPSSSVSGTTVAIPYLTYNNTGHITAASTKKFEIPVATTAVVGVMSTADKLKIDKSLGLEGIVIGSNGVSIFDSTPAPPGYSFWLDEGSNISFSPPSTFGGGVKVKISATDTKYSAGAGLKLSGTNSTVIAHSTTVTPATVGSSATTRGIELDIPYFEYNGTGHVINSGTHIHTIPEASTNTAGVVSTAAALKINQGFPKYMQFWNYGNLNPVGALTAISIPSGSTYQATFNIGATDGLRFQSANLDLQGQWGMLLRGYSTMTSATLSDGTSTTAQVVSAKVINDFVDSKIAISQTGAATFQGTATSTSPSSAGIYSAGQYWLVGTAGTYINNSVYCEPGDMIFATASATAVNTGSTADFTVIQQNLTPIPTSWIQNLD